MEAEGMKKAILRGILLVMVLSVATAIAGPKMEIGEDSWLRVRFLGQPHFSYQDDAADKEEFYLRRGRIIIDGQIADGVNFFMETDNDNAGKAGAAPQTDIQDCYADIRVLDKDEGQLWVQAGLILLPFSFENRSSAASLLGVDYNAEAIKLANTFVWRNYGVELHGNYGERIACRVGAFDGYGAADDASVRMTGHLEVALKGKAQIGGFFSQNRLKNETYVSVGAGIDYQDGANVDAATNTVDNQAWVVDVQSCISINEDMAVTVNGAYYDYDSAAYEGNTAFVEAGLLYDKAMITLKYSLADPASGSSTDDITVGAHYFLKGNNARAGVEYRTGDSNDQILCGLQFLL
jgi:hypothetical protein